MAEIGRMDLYGKLNTIGFQSLESATAFCKMRGNPYIELAHWVHQLLQLRDSDVHRIIQYFDLDLSRLAGDLTKELDKFPRGATTIAGLSSHLDEAVERAWIFATLMFGENAIRTGHLIVGTLKTKHLRQVLIGTSAEFAKINVETLTDDFRAILQDSPEHGSLAPDSPAAVEPTVDAADPATVTGDPRGQESLRRFSVDLTERARKGEIDPIVGRDREIRTVIDILMRRRQNNPILTGEAGVGKTALVEGFALRIAAGDVPPRLRRVCLRTLDVGLLQAGASMRGEFENRLRQVIEEVQASPDPIILFIDEAHTLIGAGGAAGTGDAANLLKPALARGTLRTIGATTSSEYKEHIKTDPALTRRFEEVRVSEPDPENALLMMRSIAPTLEKHHKVMIFDEALDAAIRLSERYIPDRRLPDKSVSLLDTAAARVAVSQHDVPSQVEDCRRRIQNCEDELRVISREIAVGLPAPGDRLEVERALEEEQTRLKTLEEKWEKEVELTKVILRTREQLQESSEVAPGVNQEADNIEAVDKLRELQRQLAEVQGETPLVLPSVDAQAVASVVAAWTGVPVGKMVKDEIETVLDLSRILARRIKGQDHALETIASRIQTARARLGNEKKPVGVFMLCGPSGVGKTETALTLAEALHGREQNLVTVNMSEFQERHRVSTLIGSPPGYESHGKGGVLTEAIRRQPYSVLLLDEFEKAHTDVHEIFFQVFDRGELKDADGLLVSFTNTTILVTTNAGTDKIVKLCKDPALTPKPEALAETLRGELLKSFPDALLTRLEIVPYYPLTDEALEAIARLQLDRMVDRVEQGRGVTLVYTPDVVDLIVKRCAELAIGGRVIEAILSRTVLPELSRGFLTRLIENKIVSRVRLEVKDDEFHLVFEEQEASHVQ